MKGKHTLALACVIVATAVILLSRVPGMYINPLCAFLAKMVLTACAAALCKMPSIVPGMVFAAAAPIFAWHMDIIEGQIAVAYALSCLALLIITRRVKLNVWLKAAVTAAAVAGVLAIYSSALLTLRHEKTLYAAVTYSFTRQLAPCVAIFLGALLGEKISARAGEIKR